MKRPIWLLAGVVVLGGVALLKVLAQGQEDKTPYFGLSSYGSFRPGQPVKIRLDSRNVNRVDFRVYRVADPIDFMKQQKDPHYVSNPEGIKKRTLSEKITETTEDVGSWWTRTRRKIIPLGVRKKIVHWLGRDQQKPAQAPERKRFAAFPILNDELLVESWSEEVKAREGEWWNYKDVDLHVKDAGVYLVEAVHNDRGAYTLVIVSDLVLMTTRDAKQILVYAVERQHGEPQENVELTFVRKQGVVKEGKTDKDGLFVADISGGTEEGSQVIVMGKLGKDFAIDDPYFYHWEGEDYKVYVYTERPVYRPGQTVYFKGIIRKVVEGGLEAHRGNVQVEIRDARDNRVYQSTLVTNNLGSFAGEFTLGDEPPLGQYSLQVTVEGRMYYASFRVEEYKKPEYEVTIIASREQYVVADVIDATVQAKYYFGNPVAGAQVTYFVFRSRYYIPWWRWYGEEYAWYFEEEGEEYYGGGEEMIRQGQGTLDAEGRLTLRIPTDRLDYDAIYKIEARVVDRSRREITGSKRVKVTRGAFAISIAPEKWVYQPKETVTLRVRITDFSNQPVSTEAFAKIYEHTWEGNRYTDTLIRQLDFRTAARGEATVSFTLDKGGYYRVVLEAIDLRGNRITEDEYVYVSTGAGYYRYAAKGIEIIPDKGSYAAGDVAHLLVITPAKPMRALVTVEADRVYHHQVVRSSGNSTLVNVPITEAFSPNVFANVRFVNDDQHYEQSRVLLVPPTQKFITVKVTPDRSEYRPQELGTFTIETFDRAGRPVSAEVSLGIVDEAIYAIAPETTPEIARFFYGKRWNQVRSSTSYNFSFYGRSRLAARVEADRTAAVKFADFKGRRERVPARVRKEFKDTLFWAAFLTTDAQGRAQVKVKFADNLTTWRATARAVTGDTKVGSAIQKTICRKNLIVRLETPRFFTQKDEVLLTTIVHNYLPEAKTAEVSLSATGLIVADAAPRTITVPSNGEVSLDWHTRAEQVGNAVLTAKALTDEESDAMELTAPVLPHGARQGMARSGEMKEPRETQALVLTLPAEAVRGASTLRLSLSPTLATTMLSALDYLAGYPYG